MKLTKLIIGLLAIFSFADALQAQHQQQLSEKAEMHKYVNSTLTKSKLRTMAANKEKLDSLVVQLPDANDVLQNYSKSYFRYDITGNLKSSIDYFWDTNVSAWVPDERWTIVYNQNGLAESLVMHDWDESASAWVLSGRELRAYNNAGLQTESVFTSWDANSNLWVNDYRIVYEYDSNDQLISVSDFLFNDTANNWDPFSIWEYEYLNGLVSKRTLFLYSGMQKDLQQKEEYTYNANDLLTETNIFIWNAAWLLQGQTTYAYNSDGELIEEVNFVNGTALIPETKLVYSYPFSVDMDMLVLPDLLNGFNSMPDQDILANTSEYSYNSSTQSWELVSKSMVYFSEFDETVTALLPPSNDGIQFSVYPNPAIDYIKISSEVISEHAVSLEVMDLYGNKVFDVEQFEMSESISLSGLQKGVYFVRLIKNGEINAQKFVLQ